MRGEAKADSSTGKEALGRKKSRGEGAGGGGGTTNEEEAGAISASAFPGGIEDFLPNMQIQTNWDYLGVQI